MRISRNNLLQYQEAGFGEFTNVDSSAYIRKIFFQPFDFCQYMLLGIQQTITQLTLITLTVTAIIIFDAKLFLLLLLILLPPVIIVFYFIKRRLGAAKIHIQTGNEISFRYLLDALKGYVESNIYNRNEFFMNRFITHRQHFSRHLFYAHTLQSLPSRIIEIFAIMGLFILIAIAKWSGNNDSATLLTIGAFMAAAYKIIPGIVKLINVTGQIKAYEFSLDDLVKDAKQEKPVREKPTPPAIHSIQFKNVSFGFPKQHVLQDFNLALKEGDFAGIRGESGKGKTTVLNLLLGFLTPGKGEILINGRPLSPEELKDYWPRIS